MELSMRAHQELTAWVDGTDENVQPSDTKWGEPWHCPIDRVLMVEAGGYVRCPECDRALPEGLMYRLRRLHTHR
jgi:hypothetical protein